MAVFRYRSVTEMPPPWRAADDTGNLRAVAQMLRFYRRFSASQPAQPGVRRLRSIEELNDERGDPYRRDPRLPRKRTRAS
jgi:hypothetical protein